MSELALSTLSPSKLDMWLSDCQQKWAFIYVHGMRRPPAAAFKYGIAWDRTISGEGGFWAETSVRGVPPSPHQASEMFHERWKIEAAEVEDWGDDDKEDMSRMGRQAIATLWVPEVGTKYYPHSLQRQFQFRVKQEDGTEWSLNGILDTSLFHDPHTKAVIHDDKTSSKSYYAKGKPARNVLGNLQKAAYTLGAKIDVKLAATVDCTKFVFDVHVKTKEPRLEHLELVVTEQDHSTYLRIAQAARSQMAAAIRSGYFIPNRMSNRCSQRWCPFWKECVKEHGGEVVE